MKNKIYSYFLSEFLSIFIVILLTLTFIAWVVQAVNYLEFVTEDGHSFGVYFLYSLLSLPKITAKLLPFVYFVSLFTILLNFEKNNELIIYWCAGINKITFTNQIIKISIIFTIFQILFSSFLVPYSQDKARSFLRSSDIDMFASLIKEKKFIDTVEKLTFFVEKINQEGEMKNIFLKDLSAKKTIFAKKGIILKKNKSNFLILVDGIIHSEKNNTINALNFTKTEINLSKFKTKSTTFPKIQEKNTLALLNCYKYFENKFDKFLTVDTEVETCNPTMQEIREEINKRFGTPVYIPLLTVLLSFVIGFSKDNANYKFKIYTTFFITFVFLVISEILIRYSGASNFKSLLYFLTPIILSLLIYLVLIKTYKHERVVT
jgi:lipopolysaccharide export system permease protein